MGPHGRDPVDDLLDGALKHYGDVEPRGGLDRRVLARLAAQPEPRPIRWGWVVAWVSAPVIAFAIWLGSSSGGKAPHQAPAHEQKAMFAAPIAPRAVQPVSGEVPRVRRTRRAVRVAAKAEAKLLQFPSPRPISEQELMLLEYVQHYPEEATLIAKRQDEFQAAVEQAERELRRSPNQQGR